MKNWVVNKGSVVAVTAILSIATAIFTLILGVVYIADRVRSWIHSENDDFAEQKGRVSSEYVP